jgi:hypothetical protein
MFDTNNVGIHADSSTINVAGVNATVIPSFLTDCNVTFLESVRHPESFSVTPLCETLADIRNSKYRNLIDALPSKSNEGYREAKTKLPAWAFNGTFANTVTNDNFSASNELFHFDIDNLNPDDLAAVKAKLAALPFCVFVFTSPSRAGLKGAIRIQRTIKSDADFKIVFAQAESYFQSLGITIDRSCKDVRRMCFVSYDSEVFINENPTSWEGFALPTRALPAAIKDPEIGLLPEQANMGEECIQRALSILRNAKPGNYHNARLKVGRFAGGVVTGGLVAESIILPILLAESETISQEHNDSDAITKREQNAITDAFKEGQKKPIFKLITRRLKDSLIQFKSVGIHELSHDDAEKYSELDTIKECKEFALQVAILFKKFNQPFVFQFGDGIYVAHSKCDGTPSIKDLNVRQILDCEIKMLHSILDDTNHLEPKLSHIVETNSKREGKRRLRFESNELASVQHFKSQLATVQQISQCKADDLNLLVKELYKAKAPKIREMQYLGYDKKSECFVFPHFLYDTAGNRHALNSSGYFDVGLMPYRDNSCVKAVQELSAKEVGEFLDNLFLAFGYKGILALSFWIGATFSHVVFEQYGLFPMLSFYGATHSGKSTLSKMLNQCFFVDWEGITMTKGNTFKSELRKISQKSSLVIPMLEFTSVDSATFNMDTLLGAYNRNPIGSRAAFSNDNQTIDIPIHGALAFVQNYEPFKSRAQKERVVSIYFPDDELDTASDSFQWLIKRSSIELAGIGDYILRNRGYFETRINPVVDKITSILITRGVKLDRIAKNYAITAAGVILLLKQLKQDQISNLCNLSDYIKYVEEAAKYKCLHSASDLDMAEEWLAIAEAASEREGVVRKGGKLFVVAAMFGSYVARVHPNMFERKSLHSELERHHRFIDKNKNVHLNLPEGSKKYKCWEFKL